MTRTLKAIHAIITPINFYKEIIGKKMKKAFMMITVLTFTTSLSAVDLISAVDLAFKSDPQFLRDKNLLDKQKELVNQARAPLLPNISISGSYSDTDNSTSNDTNTQNIGVTLSQTIFDREKFLNLEQSQLNLKVAELNFLISKEQTILRIVDAYFSILIAQNNLKTIQSEKDAVKEQLEFAKRNFEVGTSTITDQQEAQARFDLIRASEIRTENDLAIARTNLEKSLLVPLPENLLGINKKVRLEKPKLSKPKEWMQIARDDNLKVKIARIKTKLATLNLKKRKIARTPSLNLSLSANNSTVDSTTSITQDIKTATLSISAPIYKGGSISASERQAISELKREENTLEFEMLNADRLAGKAFRTFIAGLSQVEALEAAEESSKVALESNKLGYEVGVRINIDVLNAQRQLFSTQRDLAISRYDALRAKLELLSAIGDLDLSAVKQMSQLISDSN